MTLTIPISRFRRLLFAVLQAIAPARASAAAHAQLSQLYDRWGTAVFRAAYAYLHNKSDAEDVLQDTFLQYMRTSPELESPAHEKAWLLRVAINLSKNKLNSAWFKRTDTLEESYPCADLDSNLAFVGCCARFAVQVPRTHSSVLSRRVFYRGNRTHSRTEGEHRAFPAAPRTQYAQRDTEGGV